jgi:phosphoadenosine phosphosulfate reductase
MTYRKEIRMNGLPFLTDQPTPEEILAAGMAAAEGRVSLACSFSMEDVVIIDIALKAGLTPGIFALDTGRLNEETYEAADAVASRYRLKIDWYFPDRERVERLERDKGLHSFYESLDNRHECCGIRKVEPLSRALAGLKGWITGMRREQGVTRQAIQPVERDAAHGGILKINPLADWTESQVVAYVAAHRLPVNRLYQQGYRSIGCAPCTRAVQPGEPVRAGRWWWEDPEQKECGLHRR